MLRILVTPLTYLVLMISGYLLRKKEIVKSEDANTLGIISFSFLLPMAIASSFRGFEFDFELILIVIGSFLLNVILGFLGKVVSGRKDLEWQAVFLLNNSSYNIGSLVLPFIVTLYDPKYLIYMSMFDVGNAIYSMGLNHAFAKSILFKGQTTSFRAIFKTLLSSVPFVTYMIMLTIVGMKVVLPSYFFDITSNIGQANVVIVMLMFGILFESKISKEALLNSMLVLFVRYGMALVAALLVWILPLDLQARQVLVLCLFSPMTSAIATYCMKLGIDREKYALINTLSMPISILIITVLTLIWV